MSIQSIRKDWKLIESFVDDHSKILDIGCGEGELIQLLEYNKNADMRGMEIDKNLAIKEQKRLKYRIGRYDSIIVKIN